MHHQLQQVPCSGVSKIKKVNTNEKYDTFYQLVLFTTDDGYSSRKQQKIQLFREMSDLFHSRYRFRSILFTTTPQLIQSLNGSSVLVVSDFKYCSIFVFN